MIPASEAEAGGLGRPYRRILLGVFLMLLAGLLLLVARSASWLLEPNLYASVRSIEQAATYRDPR